VFVLSLRDGSRLNNDAVDLNQACIEAVRAKALLEQDGMSIDCLAVLGLDRPGLFDVPRPEGLRPTGDEVRALGKVAGMQGAQIATLVGSTPRKYRAWVGGEEAMPWASWHILAIYVGLSSPQIAI
jgi:hypothetical protein